MTHDVPLSVGRFAVSFWRWASFTCDGHATTEAAGCLVLPRPQGDAYDAFADAAVSASLVGAVGLSALR